MPGLTHCPHLGLFDDRDTYTTFASRSNHCYRLPKHKRVQMDHQDKYCLNDDHLRCPIFLSGRSAPVSKKKWYVLILIVLTVIFLVQLVILALSLLA